MLLIFAIEWLFRLAVFDNSAQVTRIWLWISQDTSPFLNICKFYHQYDSYIVFCLVAELPL